MLHQNNIFARKMQMQEKKAAILYTKNNKNYQAQN